MREDGAVAAVLERIKTMKRIESTVFCDGKTYQQAVIFKHRAI